MYWTICLLGLIYIFYKKSTKSQDFFKNLGIKYETPWFLLGTTGVNKFIKRRPISDFFRELYNKHSKEKVFGIFDITNPVIIIRDLNLIKTLAIKDFDHFSDRRISHDNEYNDAMKYSMMSLLTGKKWSEMRTTLSPIFTSNKIKHMFEIISHCSNELVEHLVCETKKTDIMVFDMKKLFSYYFIDTIASCAFGIQVNSFKDPNNSFLLFVKKIINFATLKAIIKIHVLKFMPKIAKLFNLKSFNDDVCDFFRNLILDTMQIRIKENILRTDMLNTLMQIRIGNLEKNNEITKTTIESYAAVNEYLPVKDSSPSKRHWTDDELVAQCLLFLQAGIDSTSSALSFAAIELAINVNVQEKLYNEIIQTELKLNGEQLNYEILISMKYMDMVISEVLRKWPNLDIYNRVCVKDYVLNDGESLKLNIKYGTEVWFLIGGIHMDPKYFQNPETFDPERFNKENIHKIVPGSYMPFGVGPRNCIASKFGLLMLKSVLYNILKEFKFEICSKTTLPLKSGFSTMFPEKGIHLVLRRRLNK